MSAAALVGAGCNALLDIDDVEFGVGPVGGSKAGGAGGIGGQGGQGAQGGMGAQGGVGGTGGTGGAAGAGGSSGECHGQPSGTACGDASDDECTNPDACDTAGICQPNHETDGTACGSTSDNACTAPDTCDGAGTCQPNHEPLGTPCGSSTYSACEERDSCDGAGSCDENPLPSGTSCGDSTDSQCANPDSCNATGGCLQNDETDGTACTDCASPPCATCMSGYCPNQGQSYLDVGRYDRTYSASNASRGYWFVAPVGFTIVGLRVPEDAGTAVQNVEIVRFNTPPPPAYSTTTTDFASLAYFANVAGSAFIPVSVVVLAGETIGVLGTRGTGTANNSYGRANTYDTSILGQAVTIERLRWDGDLNAGPATELSDDNGNPYARIEMLYTP